MVRIRIYTSPRHPRRVCCLHTSEHSARTAWQQVSAPHSFRRATVPTRLTQRRNRPLSCRAGGQQTVKLLATVTARAFRTAQAHVKGPTRSPRRAGHFGAAESRLWGSVPPAAASCLHNQARGGYYEPVYWGECGWAPLYAAHPAAALEGHRALGSLSSPTRARQKGRGVLC